MVMVEFNGNESAFSMDGYLSAALDVVQKAINYNDQDMLVIVDGREGSGKSTLAFQMAAYVDRDFNLSRVCFTPDQFIECIHTSKKGQAVVFDEAFTGLLSRQSMSRTNIRLLKILAEVRQKNLFMVIVMPSIQYLDRYVSVHRSEFLVHVTLKSLVAKERRFDFYNYDRKEYIMSEKSVIKYKTRPNFYGHNPGWIPFLKEDYLKKKAEALYNRSETGPPTEAQTRRKWRQLYINNMLPHRKLLKDSEWAKIFDLEVFSFRNTITLLKKEGPI